MNIYIDNNILIDHEQKKTLVAYWSSLFLLLFIRPSTGVDGIASI